MIPLEFTWLLPPGLAAGLCLLAAGIFVYAYLKGPEQTPASLRTIWLVKRLGVLVVLLLLFSSPKVVKELKTPLTNDIWLVLDNSKSMGITEQGRTRYEKAMSLQNSLTKQLEGRYQIRLGLLGNGGKEIEGFPSTPLAGTSPLGDDLNKLSLGMDERLTRAVVLISDGRVTNGASLDSAAPALSRLGATVVGLTLGEISKVTDFSLSELETPSMAAQGEPFTLTFTVKRTPSSPANTSATLVVNGRTAQTINLTFGATETEKHLSLKTKIDQGGFVKVGVKVPGAAGEVNLADNQQERLVKVALTKAKTLLIWGKPDPNMGAIARFLEKERGSVARAILPGQDKEMTFGGSLMKPATIKNILADPNQLRQFDLIVVGDANLNSLHPRALSNLELANRYYGLGVIWVFGGEGAVSYSPALPKPVSINRAQYTYQPGSGLYRLLGKADPPTLSTWPTLGSVVASSGAKPEETLLWAIGSVAGQVRYPLMSCQGRLGRSCGLYTNELWRWFLVPDDRKEVPEQAGVLFRQAVEYLTDKSAPKRLTVTLGKNRLIAGENMTADIEAMNGAYEPLREGSLMVSTRCAGRVLHREVVKDIGRLSYESPPLPAGACQLLTELSGPDGVFNDRKDFLVESQNLEMATRDADPQAMLALLKAVKGTEATEKNLVPTVSAFEPKPVFQREIREIDLGRSPWLLAIALSLLAVEWFWRRRVGVP